MTFPPIDRLIPHRPPMLLVDEVIFHRGRTVICRTTIGADMLFVKGGRVSALLALELFAQSAATLVSLSASHFGAKSLESGAILGTRALTMHVDAFEVGDVLEIECEETLAIGMTAQMDCRLRRVRPNEAPQLLAEGSINVMAGAPPASADEPGLGLGPKREPA